MAGPVAAAADGRWGVLAVALVAGDALAHLVVPGLSGGEVEPGPRLRLDQPLGMGALAGARAAEHEGQSG